MPSALSDPNSATILTLHFPASRSTENFNYSLAISLWKLVKVAQINSDMEEPHFFFSPVFRTQKAYCESCLVQQPGRLEIKTLVFDLELQIGKEAGQVFWNILSTMLTTIRSTVLSLTVYKSI